MHQHQQQNFFSCSEQMDSSEHTLMSDPNFVLKVKLTGREIKALCVAAMTAALLVGPRHQRTQEEAAGDTSHLTPRRRTDTLSSNCPFSVVSSKTPAGQRGRSHVAAAELKDADRSRSEPPS